MDPRQLAAFAKRLKQERNKLDLTRSAFCEAAGITRTTLRQLENGTQHPEPKTIERLAAALRLTPAMLTGETRINSDNPLLKDLTDEDLLVAQMYHHAGMALKQKTLGTLQERQPPHGTEADLSADVAAWARRLLALAPNQRYVAGSVITELEAARWMTVGGNAAPLVVAEGAADTAVLLERLRRRLAADPDFATLTAKDLDAWDQLPIPKTVPQKTTRRGPPRRA